MEWFALLLVIVMLAAALAALLLPNMISAIASVSVVSLMLSLVFVLLRAPDVAMTEAAVGSGLSGLILALGIRRLGLWRIGNTGENLLHRHQKSAVSEDVNHG